jgi:hypothetical protein
VNAQEQQVRRQLANDTQNLDQSIWNNTATGITHGSFSDYAYQSQYMSLKQSFDFKHR